MYWRKCHRRNVQYSWNQTTQKGIHYTASILRTISRPRKKTISGKTRKIKTVNEAIMFRRGRSTSSYVTLFSSSSLFVKINSLSGKAEWSKQNRFERSIPVNQREIFTAQFWNWRHDDRFNFQCTAFDIIDLWPLARQNISWVTYYSSMAITFLMVELAMICTSQAWSWSTVLHILAEKSVNSTVNRKVQTVRSHPPWDFLAS